MPPVCRLLDVVRGYLFNATVSILDCAISNSRMERLQKEVVLFEVVSWHLVGETNEDH
jgi:hypothetical protein